MEKRKIWFNASTNSTFTNVASSCQRDVHESSNHPNQICDSNANPPITDQCTHHNNHISNHLMNQRQQQMQQKKDAYSQTIIY